jgi:hypothetical protein
MYPISKDRLGKMTTKNSDHYHHHTADQKISYSHSHNNYENSNGKLIVIPNWIATAKRCAASR